MNEVVSRSANVWWLGQGSFVFESVHSCPIVVDPYLSDSVGKRGGPKRLFPVPVEFARELQASGSTAEPVGIARERSRPLHCFPPGGLGLTGQARQTA